MLKLSLLLRSKHFNPFIYTNQYLLKFEFATLSSNACCYDILGLKKNATANEIKEAYLSLVKKYHPDHNKEDPDAEENFKILSKAYETLKDPATRQIYDLSQTKSANFQSSQRHTANRSSGFGQENSEQYSDYSQKYEDHQSRRYYDSSNSYSRSPRAQSNAVIGSFISRVCLILAVVFGLEYMFSNRSKTENNRSKGMSNSGSPARSMLHPGFAAGDRGESGFGEIAANNPLAFVRDRSLTPEKLQQEIAKKQFRVEHTRAIVRGPPEGEAMKKKWSKEKKKTIKDLDKLIKQKGFDIKKSTNDRVGY